MRQPCPDGLITLVKIFITIDNPVCDQGVGETLDLDGALLFAVNLVLDVGVRLVGDEDLAWGTSGFEPCGQVHSTADDGVVHPVIASEVSYRAHAGADADLHSAPTARQGAKCPLSEPATHGRHCRGGAHAARNL